ncbi:Gfo/Idh/MocA family oxidoreductase [Chitinophaga agrisoli]|uniref:Gfo/Idh/MocA family oxidoreductase n=1 Tax=Chitinophaga agrisoli TaxID=2607653 RepID=A0A5B2W0G9_9BACT|nr:Gfo/Idh/MocA family oxidoreductase [Chitinophaga agrisoli]KAA2244835.1 Gfo/Idh/MocA family oxidoreductase [Chitinophaga agrisoli]
MKTKNTITRRQFIDSAAKASLAFTIVPRHVLGGPGYVAPSDKLNLAYIGCGTQGLREMCELITNPELQIVSVCDPNKVSTNYVDWSPNGIRNGIRTVLGDPNWGASFQGIPGGRDIGKELVEKYYSKQQQSTYKGCTAYNDFRELLEKEKDIDAVKIMTPDHLHAYISIAAMKKGKHVVIHKPLANRMYEAKLVIETARQTGVSTHLLAWSKRPGAALVKQWIAEGHIGTLREIHNWSNRPVWPQWTSNPTDTPPVPEDFDWNLWLGPVPDRPYHPNYTNNVFRGWYDFGAGSIADMGHYSLWPLFLTLGINTAPLSAEAWGTTTSAIDNHVSHGVPNDVAFPYSCIVRFKFLKQETLPSFELFWYDGGMRPNTPDELGDGVLEREGMMFVGDKGKIIAGFRCESPRLLPDSKMASVMKGQTPPKEEADRNDKYWIDAFRNKTQSPGSFLLAGPVTETILLGGVALRSKKRLEYNSKEMRITNNEDANKYFHREYRKGWEL